MIYVKEKSIIFSMLKFSVFTGITFLFSNFHTAKADIVKVGKGSYSTSLQGTDTTITATPKITPQFKGMIPTNDWVTSLTVGTATNPHSFTMFPHPLAV